MIGDLGAKAMQGGIKSGAWQDYMRLFAKDKNQLDRLCGLDKEFMKFDDGIYTGELLLGYVLGGAPCMSGTALALPAEILKPRLRKILDGNL